MSLKEKIELIFKRKYHWYTVKFNYRTKEGFHKFDFTSEIGVVNKSNILNHRSTKKTISPMHLLNKGVQKKYLSNGTLTSEAICYLGYFAQQPKKQNALNFVDNYLILIK